jgi:hypothetical protein
MAMTLRCDETTSSSSRTCTRTAPTGASTRPSGHMPNQSRAEVDACHPASLLLVLGDQSPGSSRQRHPWVWAWSQRLFPTATLASTALAEVRCSSCAVLPPGDASVRCVTAVWKVQLLYAQLLKGRGHIEVCCGNVDTRARLWEDQRSLHGSLSVVVRAAQWWPTGKVRSWAMGELVRCS